MSYGIGDPGLVNRFLYRILIFIKKSSEDLVQDKFQDKICYINKRQKKQKLQKDLPEQNPVIRQTVPNSIVNIITDVLQKIFGIFQFVIHYSKNKKSDGVYRINAYF